MASRGATAGVRVSSFCQYLVFGAFMLTDGSDVQQLGFLLAFAILIDATVVRLFLLPAPMRLLGRWNWWLPGRTSRPRPGRGSGG